jgi:hypothetical protein
MGGRARRELERRWTRERRAGRMGSWERTSRLDGCWMLNALPTWVQRTDVRRVLHGGGCASGRLLAVGGRRACHRHTAQAALIVPSSLLAQRVPFLRPAGRTAGGRPCEAAAAEGLPVLRAGSSAFLRAGRCYHRQLCRRWRASSGGWGGSARGRRAGGEGGERRTQVRGHTGREVQKRVPAERETRWMGGLTVVHGGTKWTRKYQ